MRIFRANLVSQLGNPFQFIAFDARINSGSAKRREHIFGGNVADEVVSREGAAAETCEGAIETAATRLIRSQDLVFSGFGAGVEMHAKFDAGDMSFRDREDLANKFRRCGAHGVGKGNR